MRYELARCTLDKDFSLWSVDPAAGSKGARLMVGWNGVPPDNPSDTHRVDWETLRFQVADIPETLAFALEMLARHVPGARWQAHADQVHREWYPRSEDDD